VKFTSKAARPFLGLIAAAVLVCGSVAGIGPTAVAKADGCGSGAVPFITTWSFCDFGYFPDGAHTHCDGVFVFGIGGQNCYFVPGLPPPPPGCGPPPPGLPPCAGL
jgi:hypothetical protein